MVYDVSSFRKSFRTLQGQEEEKYIPTKNKDTVSKGTNKKPDSSYRKFLEKYWDLENTIGTLTATDLLFYFRETAKESDIRYVIVNMQRDVGVFKRLLKDFSSFEICIMIEFLFNSNQSYLDVRSLQPTVLVSGWCNKIYQDSILWCNDEYVDKEDKDSLKTTREWKKQGNSVKIGEW